jgi:hypothetical protein
MSIRLLPQSTLPRVEFGPLSCGMKHRLLNQPVHVFFFSHRHKKNHLFVGIKPQSAIANGICTHGAACIYMRPWGCIGCIQPGAMKVGPQPLVDRRELMVSENRRLVAHAFEQRIKNVGVFQI